MENTTIPTPTPTTSAPAVATPPTPAPTPAPTPMVMTNPTPTMAEGGTTSEGGGVKSFFQSLNWMEVGLSILAVASLSYVIYYYRFKLQQDKLINNELQRQIDEIKMNLQPKLKGKYKTI
jgi:hypothetical protein